MSDTNETTPSRYFTYQNSFGEWVVRDEMTGTETTVEVDAQGYPRQSQNVAPVEVI